MNKQFKLTALLSGFLVVGGFNASDAAPLTTTMSYDLNAGVGSGTSLYVSPVNQPIGNGLGVNSGETIEITFDFGSDALSIAPGIGQQNPSEFRWLFQGASINDGPPVNVDVSYEFVDAVGSSSTPFTGVINNGGLCDDDCSFLVNLAIDSNFSFSAFKFSFTMPAPQSLIPNAVMENFSWRFSATDVQDGTAGEISVVTQVAEPNATFWFFLVFALTTTAIQRRSARIVTTGFHRSTSPNPPQSSPGS